ncbi:MAG: phosphotransferase [Dermatophilaceae bacterium]
MTPRPILGRTGLAAWAREWARGLGVVDRPVRSTSSPDAEVVATPSGAEIITVADIVVKVHRVSTDVEMLRNRLVAVGSSAGAPVWVSPLATTPRRTPDGRWATIWPRVEVLDPSSVSVPWADAGALLARWHATRPVTTGGPMPAHGGPARLARALTRARMVESPERSMLVALGERLVRDVDGPAHLGAPVIRPGLVHGDWHLGQLGRADGAWRLIDVDDLGAGDPAWDLGRPAGFWAAGLLDDYSWRSFLDGYRDAAGPAVPPTGDPWPRLDLPAQCAVFVAAVRELARTQDGPGRVGGAGLPDAADLRSLLTACAQMWRLGE